MALSLGYVAPAASLANAWDTRMGGALADAVSCNAVVKAFGAEEREDARLGRGRRQMARPHAAHLDSAARSTARSQGAMLLLLRAAIIGLGAAALVAGPAPRPATSPSC